jgi:hypothetical protein
MAWGGALIEGFTLPTVCLARIERIFIETD